MLVEIPEVIQTGFKVPHKVLRVERVENSNKIRKSLVANWCGNAWFEGLVAKRYSNI